MATIPQPSPTPKTYTIHPHANLFPRMNVGEASVKRARNVLDKAAPAITEQIKQGKMRVGAVSKDVLAKPHEQQVKALEERRENKPSNTSDEYDKAEKKLIERLKALRADTAEACMTETIKKLKETVTTMKRAVEADKKAA